MPNGIFLLNWTETEGYVIAGKCWQEGDESVLDNLVMRISMKHEEPGKFSKIPTPRNTFLYSYSFAFKEKRKKFKAIIGLDLQASEEAEKFDKSLVKMADSVKEHVSIEREELDRILCGLLASALDMPAFEDKSDELRRSMKARAKQLMGEMQIDEANHLLELMKTVPDEIQRNITEGAHLTRQNKIAEAELHYKKAAQLAKEIDEEELAVSLEEEFKRLSQRPKVILKIQAMEEKARKAVREEKFDQAGEIFMTIAKEAAKLNDVDLMQEFTTRSKLMQQYDAVIREYAGKRSF